MSTFFDLQPGQHILCRHMLSNQQLEELTSSRQKRHLWLTTTTNSWIYIIDQNRMDNLPYDLQISLKMFVFLNPKKCSHPLLEGGIFRYPPYIKDVDSLLDLEPNRFDPRALTTWRECHRLLFRARLKSVCYINLTQESSQNSRRRSPRKKARKDNGPSTSKAEKFKEERNTDNILDLWPSCQKGLKKNSVGSLKFSWCEMETRHPFSTWKPCAFSQRDGHDQCREVEDVLAGLHDSDLGLVCCERTYLFEEEMQNITQSSRLVIDHEFVLLVDAYTNRENHQVLVLNRAFRMTYSILRPEKSSPARGLESLTCEWYLDALPTEL
ncbi:hypothetical protein PoB_002358500 [Plakobranchus ocellatus]|uniref:Uncharacterized protein n=1 Tax=Plakobranchus ocellatus TaxID=259542 RepID=A0AAV3ZPJ5_9GAST|nr:hypothetical protein PoB_002358500 [Plakobranchus ocellatus]